ncbi:MAG TPA: ester cyclase [Candidatus Dormibacteraeota bacterium]|nr:ester cyclase [Candidatus Dormibacteraeota bacterium]
MGAWPSSIEVLTPDFADHSPCRQQGGADALRERIVLLRLAMPDLHVCIDNMAAAGDMTWAAVTVRGTGKAVPGQATADGCLGFSRIETCRYVDGRIAEYWSETADLMEQLGITVT